MKKAIVPGWIANDDFSGSIIGINIACCCHPDMISSTLAFQFSICTGRQFTIALPLQ
jgi:hypothetical protein